MFDAWLRVIRAFRRRSVHRRFFDGDREVFHAKLYNQSSNTRILSGPFSGTAYLNTADFGPIAPRWLGSYECEIQDLVGQICESRYETIVNIGSAEGYYAIGFAVRRAASCIFAYDIDPFARRALATMARMNGIADLISVREVCRWDELNRFQNGKNLLLVDIEGAEVELLVPSNCSALKRFDILVELHESTGVCAKMTVEETIRKRFAATHVIQRRHQTDRSEWLARNKLVWSERLTEEEAVRATNEFRTGNQVWLWLRSCA
jgi:hypothetical protein